MSAAVNTQDFETAAKIRDQEKELKNKLETEKSQWQEKNARVTGEVGQARNCRNRC